MRKICVDRCPPRANAYHEVSLHAQHHLLELLDESLRVVDALQVEVLLALQRGAQNLTERAAKRRVVKELDRQARVRGDDLVLCACVCGKEAKTRKRMRVEVRQ